MEAEKANHSISLMCRVLKASRSGYYDWLKKDKFDAYRHELIELVKDLHEKKRQRLGSRRMSQELCKRGYQVGRYKARRLMREAGVECRQRRRVKVTTDSKHGYKCEPNLLQQQFETREPNCVWVADITAIWTLSGWIYLAAVMDLYNRQIVGWAIANNMRVELTLDALEMAIERCNPEPGLVHHSDRGSQYASTIYQDRLRQEGMIASMSRKGNCWDNAVMERFFGSLKSEWTDHCRYQGFHDASKDIAQFIEWEYNA
ncbi:IS3 family transposase, partial [Halorhodospira halochloris]|uniref:IS3 family transposase n=1 Tax=Halorhodospira halochloris TaxID=1052 RepID=UPI001EE81F6E|nr:IS3 family transposase [Halorhodospira halochloris]